MTIAKKVEEKKIIGYSFVLQGIKINNGHNIKNYIVMESDFKKAYDVAVKEYPDYVVLFYVSIPEPIKS